MNRQFLIICFLLFTGWPGGVLAQELGLDSSAIQYSYPREYEIGGIEINGITTLDERSLIARTGLAVGEKVKIPGDEISNAIENLWKLRLFSDIQVYMDKTIGNVAFIRIETQELPRLSKFTITGLKKSETDDIRERIELIRGTPYKEHVKRNIEYEIKDYFAEKGFLNASATIVAKPDTIGNNNVTLFIDVDKGYKIRISDINIFGNDHVKASKLKKAMQGTKEKTRINPFGKRDERLITKEDLKLKNIDDALANISYGNLQEFVGDRVRIKIFSSSKFIKDDFEADKNLIIRYYNSLGYRDATVTRDSIYLVDDKNMNIDLYITEGQQYYFRDISWKGNTKYSEGRLDTILGIQRGDLYNQDLLETRLFFEEAGTDITSLYMDDGYLFFSVTPVEVLVEGDSIDLEIRITEGPQATIRNVRIVGNTKTNEHVIRRELRTRPGDKFSRTDLIRSQREIANLGFFDPEQIGVNPIPNPADGTVDLEYTVVEKPSDQLELSAGWGGRGNGVVGSVGVSFNNFSLQNMFRKGEWTPIPAGDGQRLSFRIQTNGRFFQSYNMSFTEPWLGGRKPNSFSVAFSRTLQSNGLKRDNINREAFAVNAFTVSYGKRLTFPDDFFSLLSSVTLQRYTLSNWFRSDFLVNNGDINNINIRETLARNSAGPNPLFPTQGSNISLSMELTPPYSLFNNKNYDDLDNNEKFQWIEYHKWRFTADWYTPIFGKFVLRTTAKLGYVGFYNREIGHSGFEQFQVGGDGLSNFNLEGFDIIALRGYEPFTNDDGSIRNDPIFNKFTLELRYPISLNPSSTIFGMIFAEGGNSYSTFDEYDPFDLKRAVGVGVRAFLPMFGLLGLDYGIRFDERFPGENQEASNPFDYIFKNGKFSLILGFEPD